MQHSSGIIQRMWIDLLVAGGCSGWDTNLAKCESGSVTTSPSPKKWWILRTGSKYPTGPAEGQYSSLCGSIGATSEPSTAFMDFGSSNQIREGFCESGPVELSSGSRLMSVGMEWKNYTIIIRDRMKEIYKQYTQWKETNIQLFYKTVS